MKRIFFDHASRLRNGWWVLIFIAFIATTRLLHSPLVAAMKAAGLHEAWREPLPVLFVLLATWVCLRLRRQPLSSVGLRLDARWWKQLGWGSALGLAAMLLASGVILATGAVRFELDPARSVAALGYALYTFLFAALLEELLFRGFLFQRVIDGIGVWGAQIGFAALFAVAHWENPGMEGVAKLVASLDLALAALMLGLAYVRTGSLALPLGLHLGWNWTQGSLLGFGVSGFDQAGWLQPVFAEHPIWISGGEFGPEASVFGVMVDLLVIGLLWRWRAPAVGPRARTPARL